MRVEGSGNEEVILEDRTEVSVMGCGSSDESDKCGIFLFSFSVSMRSDARVAGKERGSGV
jgi:hypothetical protein